MTSLPFPSAIKELNSRNVLLCAAYRDWSRRLPPGPVSRLASSISTQRGDLGKTLADLTADRALFTAEVEFEIAPASAPGFDAAKDGALDPKVLLSRMAAAEAAEHDLLSAAAGAALPSSSEAAELLATEAAAAQKRSIWAQDQLELLSLA